MHVDIPVIYMPHLISKVQNKMQADIRQQLSQALTNVNEHYANLVINPMTELEVYPTPFLQEYQIYRVEYFNPHKPVLFYVGFVPGKPAYLLTSNPKNYVSLAQADDVVINSPQVAVNYVTAYLEVTRSMSELFYLVSSVNDIKFRPNLTDEQAEFREAIVTKYSSVITAPTAKSINNGYLVTAYAVRGQVLEQYSITVSREGDIGSDVTTLEKSLPLLYGL